MMALDREQLAAATVQRELVTSMVLKAVANVPKAFSEPTHIALAVASTMDGVLGALAWLAATSEQYPTPRDKRLLADEVRKGLIKFMNVAERDIEAGRDWEDVTFGELN